MKASQNTLLQEVVLKELNAAADKNGKVPLKMVSKVISTLRFGNDVTTMKTELQEIVSKLNEAAEETISISAAPKGGLATATDELAAAKKTTEDAANTILDAAEVLQGVIEKSPLSANQTVNNAIMEIITACNFQDLSGQRITKVTSVLEHIRPRIERLVEILVQGEKLQSMPGSGEVDLLGGPQLGGGPSQDEIDALFDKT